MRIGLLLWLCCAAQVATAQEFTGRVIAVLDGDTVMIARNGAAPIRVRLAEIDAPEKAQAGGMESRQSLAELVLKKEVQVSSQAVDEYGRMVAHLTLDGKSVNQEQLSRGMAWEYSNYHGNKAYIALQKEAQQARRGLWAQASPQAPWQWRKLHKSDTPAATTAVAAEKDLRCGSKRHCSQMQSCEEAHFYFAQCGVRTLDGNHDGRPCEDLCLPKKK